jgi:hypothetical protein
MFSSEEAKKAEKTFLIRDNSNNRYALATEGDIKKLPKGYMIVGTFEGTPKAILSTTRNFKASGELLQALSSEQHEAVKYSSEIGRIITKLMEQMK